MKLFFYLSLLFCYSTCLFAQITIPRYPSLTIDVDNNTFRFPQIDKIHQKRYNYFEILNERNYYYNYSKDFSSLTINNNGEDETVVKFNSDGTIAYYSNPRYNLNEIYTYTDDGKVSKIESISNEGKKFSYKLFRYSSSVTTLIHYWYSDVYNKYIEREKNIYEYHKDYNKMTRYDYNLESKEWDLRYSIIDSLDSYNRTIERNTYYANGTKWIDAQYTYTNNGYIEYNWDTNRPYAIREYTFDENDYPIKEVWYNWYDDGHKDLLWIEEFEYTSSITSNDNINSTPDIKVYSLKNHLAIINDSNDTHKVAYIYNISGQLISKVYLLHNTVKVPVHHSGIYIVKIDDKSYKAIVK